MIDGKLFDSSLSAAERARVKQAVTAARLPIVSVGSSVVLTKEGPGAELHRMLEVTNDWESPFIRVYGGPLAEDPEARRKQMEGAAKVLEEAVPVAERLGVVMLLETHDSFSASKVAAELLNQVPSKWVGAIWDTHHPHRMRETPAEVYENIGARTLHVHIKDADHQPHTKVVGNSCRLAREKYPFAKRSNCSLPTVTKAISQWNGKSIGTPTLKSLRSRCRTS